MLLILKDSTDIMELRKLDEKNNSSFAPNDIIAMYAQNPKGVNIKKLISELNRTSIVWDGKDYITGAALCNPNNELLQYAKELADMKSVKSSDNLPSNGYPVSTISKLVTFGTGLDKAKLATCMDDGTDSLPTANIERAKKILETATNVGFEHKYLAHKYFIDWIIDEQNIKSIDEVCKIVRTLTPAGVKTITQIKGENYLAEIRKVVRLKNVEE